MSVIGWKVYVLIFQVKKFKSGLDFKFTSIDCFRLERYRTLGSRDNLSGYSFE